MTSGTPPARNTRTVGCGPFGSASTRRGTWRLTAIQSSTVGRRSPAACAMAGTCSSRFVDPPNAACTAMALPIAASVSTSRDDAPERRSGAPRRAPIAAPRRARSAAPTARAPRAARSARALRRRPARSRPCRGTGSRRRATRTRGTRARRPPRARAARTRSARRSSARRRRPRRRSAAASRRPAPRRPAGRACRRAPSASPAAPCRRSPRRSPPRRVGSDRISRRSTIAASFR